MDLNHFTELLVEKPQLRSDQTASVNSHLKIPISESTNKAYHMLSISVSLVSADIANPDIKFINNHTTKRLAKEWYETPHKHPIFSQSFLPNFYHWRYSILDFSTPNRSKK